MRLFILGMLTVALGLSAFVENYTLHGDIGRMNTVFKFYLQIWMLYGLASAVALVLIVVAFRRWVPLYCADSLGDRLRGAAGGHAGLSGLRHSRSPGRPVQ